MSHITFENRGAWQALADNLAPQFPNVGKTVKVVEGRKHKGKSGIVMWHGVNKFYSLQYKTDAMLTLMDMKGREGYLVKIKTDNGETFFVPAEYTEVVIENGEA